MASPRIAAAGLAGGSDAPPILLNGRFEIVPDVLADAIGSPRALAHAVRDRLNSDHSIFALACDPDLPPRLECFESFKGFPSRGLLRLLDFGVVPWPETGDHRLCLIYERPPGPKLVPTLGTAFDPMLEGEIINCVIAPVVNVLEELSIIGFTHGAIRPTNMFRSREPKSLVTVGENLSAPGHFHQSAAFASIAILQAHPAGRGAGVIADDIYALAVTILTLLNGRDPAEGRDDAALLRDKIERGSYFALCGHTRLPAILREPLRGMLEDRVEMRWNLTDLRAWLSERRLKSAHHSHIDRAQRGFSIGGKAYHQARPLGHWLAENWNKVRLEERGNEILSWARRSLGDDAVGENVLSAMENSERNSELGDGTLNPAFVARLAMALDRRAPVRYRKIGTHIDGCGAMLAVHFSDVEASRSISEILMEDLPGFRYRTMEAPDAVKPSLTRLVAHQMKVLKNPVIGFGIERTLYELNPLQYCRIPLVIDQKPMQLDDLLPALERVAGRGHQGPPFDRHIAAFIAAHLRGELQPHLVMASDTKDPERAALGMLAILATLHSHTSARAYPGVARWLSKYLTPAVSSFRHKMWREKVANELPGLIDRGDITALYHYLANGDARQRDRKGYAEAVAEYAKLSAEISFLKSFGFNDPKRVQEYGHQIASGLAGIVSFITFAFSLVIAW